MKGVLNFDGGARPTNPGPAGFACILALPGGREVIKTRPLGWTSNNVAEYTGLVVGIKLAIEHQVSELAIYTDSKLAWGHLTQGYQRKDDKLRTLIRDAEKLLHEHYEDDETGEKLWEMFWIPREANSAADALCTKTIKKYRVGTPNPWLSKAGL